MYLNKQITSHWNTVSKKCRSNSLSRNLSVFVIVFRDYLLPKAIQTTWMEEGYLLLISLQVYIYVEVKRNIKTTQEPTVLIKCTECTWEVHLMFVMWCESLTYIISRLWVYWEKCKIYEVPQPSRHIFVQIQQWKSQKALLITWF